MSHLPPSFPKSSGRFSKQAHVDVPEGLFEDEHGRNGFFGRVSHVYHKNAPTAWTKIVGTCLPQCLDLNKTLMRTHDRPHAFLGNNDVTLYTYAPKAAPNYFFRNADGDECWFIHRGSGTIETDFGPLKFRKGDYIILPRGTTYRMYPDTADNYFLLIESYSEFEIPDRGSLGRHAFYDPGVCNIPEAKPSTAPATTKDGEWELIVKRGGEFTSVFYPFNPLDAEGWKGDLFAWSLNVEDLRPITSHRYHLAPSVHTTFIAQNFVVCTFAPRPTENGDPKAQRVPFFHRNIDYDEVIFYHEGDFFSRAGITPGMVTFHPIGIHHGPHPKAFENQFTKDFLQEYAVMFDTRNPLKPIGLADQADVAEYRNSWKGYLKK